ncbi:hypothetical protein M7784_01500 [Desulfovibrio aminophilus]|nr:hypothetical protein [Desulfovibrio aminophilus]MCM0753922.1 hypothetical protein [Desulfovibrio aminophilus]
MAYASGGQQNMLPQAKPIQIIDAIRERLERGPFSEMDFARFTREAEKMKKSDPATAYDALGALACIRGDIDGVHANHKRSIKAAENPSTAWYNYAVSLAFMTKYIESIEAAIRALNSDGTNVAALGLIIQTSHTIGDIESMNSWLEKWHKLTEERHPVEDLLLEDADDAELVDEALADVEANGAIPWEKLKAELNL